ncbi:hypothetical protein TanjilG_09105 [Lupinus angustifolius]|uniref:YqaJ viral recombinase domain-containing protein n=1 Tax=Lupinus angustifolius TaxID=3871 RepID=A0A4P1R3M7_LUPAN|nr:hypothetical protein TanjilG_09105 [Lupinus angustifolius]
MEWGVINEAAAIDQCQKITGHEVSSMGFEHFGCLGACPDGLVGIFPVCDLLEVKCPYNKGKPELDSP